MPRSLASCYENLVQNLDRIANAYGRQGPAQRHARAVRARLENAKIEDIFQSGLHEFIDDFVEDNNRLGTAVAQQYLLVGRMTAQDRDRQSRSTLGAASVLRRAASDTCASASPIATSTATIRRRRA